MNSLKQFKENEVKVHDRLYQNIFLLSKIHPTTRDFDNVFTTTMFMKNNKAAFHQVIYYLLNILNPQLTKEKITAWPPYDVKLENKFRSEVLAYIHNLNLIYTDADIPNIMASQLISPTGFRFINFMLKLSVLVLMEELKKDADPKLQMLIPCKPHKNPTVTNLILKHLTEKTRIEETKISTFHEQFFKRHENMKGEAQSIIAEQTQLDANLNKIVRECTLAPESYKGDSESAISTLQRRLELLNSKWKHIAHLTGLSEKSRTLLNYLSSDNLMLTFIKDLAVLKSSQAPLEREVDLPVLILSLNSRLENMNLELPVFSEYHLNEMGRTIEEMNDKFSQLIKKLTLHHYQLIQLADKDIVSPEVIEHNCFLQVSTKKNPIIKISSYKDESLALPLDNL